jgi:hypothetical protein
MKPFRYLAGIATGLMLMLGAWGGLIYYQWDVPARPDNLSNQYAVVKMQLAREAASPKILIFGGSNVRYGLEAERIGRALGQPCFNMAIHAGLPLRYFFYQARQVARPGDTILLALEYDYYLCKFLTEGIINQIMTQEPAFLDELTPTERVRVLMGAHLEDLWERAQRKGRVLDLAPLRPSQLFLSASGDTLDCSEKSLAYRSRALLRAELGTGHLFSKSQWRAETWTELKAMQEWCKARGIKLIATYPCIYAYPSLQKPLGREFLEWLKQSRSEFPF